MTFKSVGKSVGKPVLDSLIGAGVFWVLYKITNQDPSNPAAPGRMSVQVEAALFSGLKAQLTPMQQDNLDELLALDKMKTRVREFRGTVAIIVEKLDEAKALGVLRGIADLPTADERYDRAESDGMLAPADPTVAQARFDSIVNSLGGNLGKVGDWLKKKEGAISADIDSSRAKGLLDRWATALENKTGVKP